MKTKTEIRKNVIAYLEARGRYYRDLSSGDDIELCLDEKIDWGPHQGERHDVYVLSYLLGEVGMEHLVFVYASVQSGEVYFSRGPTSYLEELELPEDQVVVKECEFVESIFSDIFEKGDFTLYEGDRNLLVYESYEYNLEFHYDFRYEHMQYGGMYIRLLENDHAYRLQELAEFFDPEKRLWEKIIEPYQDRNEITLRVHAGVIQSHLMPVLTNADISWETTFVPFLKTKQPW